MYPFHLEPALKHYLWGGTRLASDYHKLAERAVAESWELSAHPDGGSVIASGPLRSTAFADFARRYPVCCGTRCPAPFPVLIKLIDAAQPLSIQVHPADDYAQEHEGEPGKTEMWVVLDCEPGAFLYFGFQETLSQAAFARHIEAGTLPEILHQQPVRPGDVLFIRAGTIHAIGAGIVLAEVQQSSNTTYRVHDFGRVDPDGNPRPLHIEHALRVTQRAPGNPTAPGVEPERAVPGGLLQRLARCEYFTVDRLALDDTYMQELDGSTFQCVLCLDGSAQLTGGDEALALQRGQTVFVPADAGGFTLTGKGQFLLTSL